jgi:catechol 2,3-dioxygenase-like lactoylglutathione lyase family enzyme
MLKDLPCHPTVAAADLERARSFYEGTLGFEPESVSPSGVFYGTRGGHFLVFPSPGAGTAQNTVVGFAADDVEAEVRELRDRGVRFEEYDFPGLKTVDGIATVPAGRAAWFKDSEGNILGIVQLDGP